ncbi:MAG: DUF4230 domain-containing protein [bacterium]|nr:DUF4230 domain-containing protein [bacterium]
MARKDKDPSEAKPVKRRSLKSLFIMLIIGIVIGAVGAIAIDRYVLNPTTEISVVVLKEELVNCSELATTKLDIVAEERYENVSSRFIDLKWITKKGFTMKYEAEVRAGINFEDAVIEQTGRTITVTLPSADILGVTLDPDSLVFYDSNWALFNWSKKEDVAEAEKLARLSALERAKASGLVDKANEQSLELVKNLFAPLELGENPYIVNVKIKN